MTSKTLLQDRPVIISGNWEPLVFRRRVNQPYTNLAQLYEQEHTVEAVQNMQRAGVNLLITHYFKGFGLKAEADDIANAKKLIGLCRERDIKVGGYIGDTLILETMLHEEPDARDWIQVQEDGTPIRYAGTQNFRYKWCFVNPAYMNYMKKVLRTAVDAGLDLIHMDNFLYKPEPYSCHCRHCINEFRNFLSAKYDSDRLLERFGHADVAHIMPATFISPLYIAWANDVITEPVLQEWIDFKCATVADRLADLRAYCVSLNPAIAMECNPTGFWGENSIYMRSVDHARSLPATDFFWDESPNDYGLQANGALRTNIISMKMGEAFQTRMFFYVHAESPRDAERKMAEALVFNNGCLGLIGFLNGDRLVTPDCAGQYSEFLHAHPHFFCAAKSMAKVALYRNFASFAYDSWTPYLQTILCQQALLQTHVPFDLVWDLNGLQHYAVVILPGLECLSLEEVKQLAEFANRGGTVILIGQVGRCDPWRRLYPEWPFAPLLQEKGFRHIKELKMPPAGPGKEQRAIWDECFPVLDSKFWLMPENVMELTDALAAAPAHGGIQTTPGDCRNIILEPRMSSAGDAVFLHVINYDEELLHRELQISCSMESAVSRVTQLSINPATSSQLAFEQSGHELRVMMTNHSLYSFLKIEISANVPDKREERREKV